VDPALDEKKTTNIKDSPDFNIIKNFTCTFWAWIKEIIWSAPSPSLKVSLYTSLNVDVLCCVLTARKHSSMTDFSSGQPCENIQTYTGRFFSTDRISFSWLNYAFFRILIHWKSLSKTEKLFARKKKIKNGTFI
jgi:hypothetical protein